MFKILNYKDLNSILCHSMNLFNLLVICLVVFISGKAYCGDESKTWIQCRKNSDCIIARSSCGCVAALNKNYKQFAHLLGPKVCSKPVCSDWLAKGELTGGAICKKNTCDFVKKITEADFIKNGTAPESSK